MSQSSVYLSSSSLTVKPVFYPHPLFSASPSYKLQWGLSVADPILGDIHLYSIFPAWPVQEHKPVYFPEPAIGTSSAQRSGSVPGPFCQRCYWFCVLLSVTFCLPLHSS